MRILDNKHDFYDYLQDSTDVIVFDRRDSFELSREEMAEGLYSRSFREHTENCLFLLLQSGATFWLFRLNVTFKGHAFKPEPDYKAALIHSWKNYNKPNKLLEVSQIRFRNVYKLMDRKTYQYNTKLIESNAKDLVSAINNNDYEVVTLFNKHMFTHGSKYETRYSIPLLKSSGLKECIDDVELFAAIEEYFSIEKQNQERTEAIGTTNNDKITMHGFDLKTSFRGK